MSLTNISLAHLLESIAVTLDPISRRDWDGKWRILKAIELVQQARDIVGRRESGVMGEGARPKALKASDAGLGVVSASASPASDSVFRDTREQEYADLRARMVSLDEKYGNVADKMSVIEAMRRANAALVGYWQERKVPHGEADIPSSDEWLRVFDAIAPYFHTAEPVSLEKCAEALRKAVPFPAQTKAEDAVKAVLDAAGVKYE